MDIAVQQLPIQVVCIAVLLLMRVSSWNSSKLHQNSKHFGIIIDAFITFLVVDIACRFIGDKCAPLTNILNFCKIEICTSMALCWYLMASYTISPSSYKLRKWRIPLLAPFVIVCAYAAIDTFTHILDTTEHFNPTLWMLFNICCAGYIAMASIRSFKHARRAREQFLRRKLRFQAYIVLLPLAGMALQLFFMDLVITSPIMMFTLLIIYIKNMQENITVDEETGLNNSNKLSQYLEQITQSQNPGKRLFYISVALDDMERMRKVHGFHVTAEAMKQMGLFLCSECHSRETFIARSDKDSFAIISENEDFAEIEYFCNRLVSESAKSDVLKRIPWKVSFSIHWAEYGTPQTQNIDSLLDQLKENCFKAAK